MCDRECSRNGRSSSGRGAISFTFGPDKIGLSASAPPGTRPDAANVLGRQDTQADSVTYETIVGRRLLTLYDAVAISGAALSPLMGKMTRPAQRFLFTVANVRLGIWMPHPSFVALVADPPSSTTLLPFGDRVWSGWQASLPSSCGRRFHAGDQAQRSTPTLLAEATGEKGRIHVGTWPAATYDNLGSLAWLTEGVFDVVTASALEHRSVRHRAGTPYGRPWELLDPSHRDRW